jgi:hypothetical protein
MNAPKNRKQSIESIKQRKKPNGTVWEPACDDLCLGVVAASAKANHDALGGLVERPMTATR